MKILSPLLSSIEGIEHQFGTCAEPRPAFFNEVPPQRRPRWKQVHGSSFAIVTHEGQGCGEVDALLTRAPGLPIAIITADCVPILLAKKDGSAIAAVHAGWRGTFNRILENVWQHLSTEDELATNWVAAIGPAIGPCCYEVSPDLFSDFQTQFGAQASLRPRHLDLPLINELELRRFGFTDVERLAFCTHCRLAADGSPLFHSHRRNRDPGRQLSAIRLLER